MYRYAYVFNVRTGIRTGMCAQRDLFEYRSLFSNVRPARACRGTVAPLGTFGGPRPGFPQLGCGTSPVVGVDVDAGSPSSCSSERVGGWFFFFTTPAGALRRSQRAGGIATRDASLPSMPLTVSSAELARGS